MTEEQAMKLLLPCPKCGKLPKIKVIDYGQSGMGASVRIQCKPLFRNAHISTTQTTASIGRALGCAVTAWNYEVNYAKVMGGK